MATESAAAFLARRQEREELLKALLPLQEHAVQHVTNSFRVPPVYVPSVLTELINQHKQQELERRRAGVASLPSDKNEDESEDLSDEEDDMDVDPDYYEGEEDDMDEEEEEENGVGKVTDPILSSDTHAANQVIRGSTAQGVYCNLLGVKDRGPVRKFSSMELSEVDICICLWNVSNAVPKLIDEENDMEGLLPEILEYGAAYFLGARERIPNSADVGHILYLNSSGPLHPDNCITIDQVFRLLSTRDERLMDPNLLVVLRAIIVDRRMGFIPDQVRQLMAENCISCPAFSGQYNKERFISYIGMNGVPEFNAELEKGFAVLEQCEAILRELPSHFFQPKQLSDDLLKKECVKFQDVNKNILCDFSMEHLVKHEYFELTGVKAIKDARESNDDFFGFEAYVPHSIFGEEYKADDKEEEGEEESEDDSDLITDSESEQEEEEEEEGGDEECRASESQNPPIEGDEQ